MYVFRIHMAVNNIQFTRIEIRIAKYLFKHYNDRYNARQLARILNINHAHANKLCNILADKHLLAKEEIRKSELVETPIRYVDIAERDILLNKEDKIFYNILSESLVFHNPEKYVEVVRKCRK